MDETLVPRDSATRQLQPPQTLDLLRVSDKTSDKGNVRDNPFEQKKEEPVKAQGGDVRGNPFGDAQPPTKGSPYNPKDPKDNPAVPGVLDSNYRTLTSEQLNTANPTKLIIRDFPTTDQIRPSREPDGRYYLFFHNDPTRKIYLPPNLTDIEIWQNGRKYDMKVSELKSSYDQWARTNPPANTDKDKGKDKDKGGGKDKDKTVVVEGPKKGDPKGPPPVPDVPGFLGKPQEQKATSGSTSLVVDRSLGALSGIGLTSYASYKSFNVSALVAPAETAALATQRSLLLPLVNAKQTELATVLKSGLPADSPLTKLKMQNWPVSEVPVSQTVQFEQWTALNKLAQDVRKDGNYRGGPLFKPGDHTVATMDATLSSTYSKYSSARTQYEAAMAQDANLAAARSLERKMLAGNFGALAASEVGKHLFDGAFFKDSPASIRTTICDMGSPLIMMTGLPWYAKGGIMLGTHVVNRAIDSWK